MIYEVESKNRVESIDRIKQILEENNAGYLGVSMQDDMYYNSLIRDYARTDEALRIRDTGDSAELTYKGPKVKAAGAKAREEYNVAISSAEDMEKVLLKTGFFVSRGVKKRREEYLFMDATIALDIVEGLGHFVEIEIISEDKDSAAEKINEIKEFLEVTGESIQTSYLEMIIEKEGNF
ncbi:class IV adenylate cyclase [Methanoplanus limicola]|uniref:Adenylyl cyclase CyaB n=1 Tax=Methanoplanus limicola DSM 2279 TaxID=937775 RepID=H1Z4B3_9EURY|nr:class IV adenylate cyclase [Methanoplanus limicola]EHQ36661.1 adenylyl cyclase CyaB [Methanoplanus limicola DSM 2279]